MLTSSEIIEGAHQILITRYELYLIITPFALYVYEYLITLEDEVRFMWPARWSIMKSAFFLNRYLPFVSAGGLAYITILAVPGEDYCRDTFLVFGSTFQANFLISELILHYRAYAVWGRSRIALLVLSTVFLCMTAVTTYLNVKLYKSIVGYSLVIYPRGCVILPHQDNAWIQLLIFAFSETVSLVAVLLKAYRLRGSWLMSVIYKDGLSYYFIILITFIITVILSQSTLMVLRNLLIILQSTLHSIFCTRMLLHIRASYDKFSSVPAKSSELALSGLMKPVEPVSGTDSARLSASSEPEAVSTSDAFSHDDAEDPAPAQAQGCSRDIGRRWPTGGASVSAGEEMREGSIGEEVAALSVPYDSLDVRTLTRTQSTV